MERYGLFIAFILLASPLDKQWEKLEKLREKIAATEPYVSPADRLEEKRLSKSLVVKEKLLQNFARSDDPKLKKWLSILIEKEEVTQQDLEALQRLNSN